MRDVLRRVRKCTLSIGASCSYALSGAPPCSWGTREDATLLLGVVALALRTGRGEELRDRRGYTLRDWEAWAEEDSRAKRPVTARVRSVRRLLSRPY